MNTQERIIRAAGILEGEGSFFIRDKGFSPTVSCNMTDQDVIHELHNLFGGNMSSEYQPRREGSKSFWLWRIHGEDAVKAIEAVRPYMFTRRTSKIDEVLKIWYDRKEELNNAENFRKKVARAYLDGEGSFRAVAKKYGTNRTTVYNAVQNYNPS